MIATGRRQNDFLLLAEQWLPASPEKLWPFVTDCRHMNFVLPAWIRFHVVDPRIEPLATGVRYRYRLRLHGLPLSWTTRIEEVDAPRFFADEQERGPYARFRHEHTYLPRSGGTLTRDRVIYRPPGGPLAGLANAVVRRDLTKLFENRHRVLAGLYASGGDPAPRLAEGPGRA
ncbi:SRPBCC family protein [Phycisphaera mikurensis]|uniref:Coenzyme Q-binding protein COQ10 START domain-containing protein n=1 Tax=Phycisphaera mikurensis (strain NBRC 102666 / KCTC 22515 / FYK2301M01) TaxID=1142394 RepID=I0IDA7_PHYMF|nr:SRPBCC family protein [Phycisphaera mikurensis]MBB6442370.1 hypothetical protein [Phycisphaera mikurensis]BAM03245.1 hypothetical protein PSMK_10860 [Phycisphaera mikurensis NBRC 102666]